MCVNILNQYPKCVNGTFKCLEKGRDVIGWLKTDLRPTSITDILKAGPLFRKARADHDANPHREDLRRFSPKAK